MKITQKAIAVIRSSVTNLSFETGGIMGSQDGLLVTDIIMDDPTHNKYRCCYAPNVNFLNQCIADWNQQNKYFMGMFHTHFFNVTTLSGEDIRYINAIMNAMPKEVDRLFFPIYTLPKHEMICYKATRESNRISIETDILEIL